METQWPRLALVWMYLGNNPEDRRDAIAGLDYPHVDLVAPGETQSLNSIAELVAPDADLCVFWADDDKPIGGDFLREMVRPLVFPDKADKKRAVMHLWAGNALAIPRSALANAREGCVHPLSHSFMKLALGFLKVGETDNSSQVAFSSTERLAPMCAEPVGRVC